MKLRTPSILRFATVALATDTGVTRETNTDERGVYQFANLQSGPYKVTVAASSFQPGVQSDLRLYANEVRRGVFTNNYDAFGNTYYKRSNWDFKVNYNPNDHPMIWGLQLSSKLTFSYGLRWEYYPIFSHDHYGEAFNLTNTPSFSNPGATWASPTLNADGSVKSYANYSVISNTTSQARVLQVGARLSF